MTSLDSLLRRAAGERAALVDADGTTTFAALTAASDDLADRLRALGVGAGQVVAFQLPTGRPYVTLLRACWRIGAVAAPLHPAATEAEVAALVARLRPAAHVLGPDAADRLAAGTLDAAPTDPPRTVDPALAVVLATSGSTGTPKLVAHTHDALVHKATQMPHVHGLDPHDVVLMPAPMAHMSGLLNGVLVPGAAQMACVPMARWRPDEALAAIERHGVTFMVGPPTFFVGLMDDPGFRPERVATLRLISSGGAGVTPAFVARAADRLGAVVKRTYGSTEAPTIATTTPDDPPEVRATCDGRPLAGVELRLVDPATGTDIGGDGPGELCVRGPELFAGYLRDDGSIDPGRDADGWFRTGDVATLDAGGWLTITGRVHDVIIRGGENIAAAEVEQVLEAHPAVRQAAVVGRPDDRLGEVVVAVVVVDPGAGFDLEACRAWFAAQGVARFKAPEVIEVVDTLPVLASGKVDKAALR